MDELHPSSTSTSTVLCHQFDQFPIGHRHHHLLRVAGLRRLDIQTCSDQTELEIYYVCVLYIHLAALRTVDSCLLQHVRAAKPVVHHIHRSRSGRQNSLLTRSLGKIVLS